MPAQTFAPEVFRASRLLDFASEAELTKLVGQDVERWPEVIVKELVDNALDAADEAGGAPHIVVRLLPAAIVVEDNGPGMPAEVIRGLLDFSAKVSSRAGYVAPTRGRQGNALRAILAIPFVLSGQAGGGVEIIAHNERHILSFAVDTVRQEPIVSYAVEAAEQAGSTAVVVHWPPERIAILAASQMPSAPCSTDSLSSTPMPASFSSTRTAPRAARRRSSEGGRIGWRASRSRCPGTHWKPSSGGWR